MVVGGVRTEGSRQLRVPRRELGALCHIGVCALGCGGPGLGDPKDIVYCLGMPRRAAGRGQREVSKLLRQNAGVATRQGLTCPSCQGNGTSESGASVNDKSISPHGNALSSRVRACARARSASQGSRTAGRLISIPTSTTV